MALELELENEGVLGGGVPLPDLNEVGSERQSDFLQVTRLESQVCDSHRCVTQVCAAEVRERCPALGSGCEVHPTHPGPLPGCLPAAVCLQGSLELGGHSAGPSLTCSLTPKGSSLPSPGRRFLCSVGLGCVFCVVSNSLL